MTWHLVAGARHKKIKYILDITIGYPDGEPLGMVNVMFNTLRPRTIKLLCRVYEMSNIPTEPDELQKWTYSMWAEKDEYLERFYRTGEFRVALVEKRRLLTYRRAHVFAVHAFFLLSIFVQYILLSYSFSWLLQGLTYILMWLDRVSTDNQCCLVVYQQPAEVYYTWTLCYILIDVCYCYLHHMCY